MHSTSPHVLLEQKGRVGVITLNRPGGRSAVDRLDGRLPRRVRKTPEGWQRGRRAIHNDRWVVERPSETLPPVGRVPS